MRTYRIKRLPSGKFIAQVLCSFLFISWWESLFCGPVSDMPEEFDTPEAAEEKIRAMRAPTPTGVIREFTI